MEEKQLEDFLREEGFTDVSGNPISLEKGSRGLYSFDACLRDVERYVRKLPDDLVVHFKNRETRNGDYYATIYIPVECFEKTC
jgi:hypothetical protein|tara:strand:+ start:616 stop:864 length:249 start_codon:yes stop_codon:yes gene_type:complete